MDYYFQSLDSAAKARYISKTSIIDKQDPYLIDKWSSDRKFLPSVNYLDIVNYLVFQPSPFYSSHDIRNFRSLDAYDRFVSGWVREIATYVHRLNDGSPPIHVVKARVLHSQRLNDQVLYPWIIAEESGNILSAHCNCMAGLGESCTHVASLLFAVEATVRLKEKTTVTQEPAYWMLPSARTKVEHAPLTRMDFTSAKKMKKNLDHNINSSSDQSRLPVSRDKKKVNPASQEAFSAFLQSISADKPAFLSIHPDYSKQYVPKPLQSQFPQVLSELFDEDIVGMPYVDILNHCRMIKSEHHENFIVTDCGLHLNPDYPHLGASPDGIVECTCCGRGCLEIKCPYCTKDDIVNNSISYLENVDGDLHLDETSQYYYQVQTQLFVTNLDYCDFVVWTNEDIFVQRIEPCLSFWEPVAEKAFRYFVSVVLPELVAHHFLDTPEDPVDNYIPLTSTLELFCVCQTPEDGTRYVGCDGKDCSTKWFHFSCMKLRRKPKGKWFCPDCLKNPKRKKRKHVNED